MGEALLGSGINSSAVVAGGQRGSTAVVWLQRLPVARPCRMCAVWRRSNGEAPLIGDGWWTLSGERCLVKR